MAIVNGGAGGAAFNGGTITQPLTVDLSAADGSTVPLTVLASFNAQNVDFFRVVNSDTGTDIAAVTSAAAFQTYDRTTGALKANLLPLTSQPDFNAAHGFATSVITSGALPTVALVSGTGAFVSGTGRDVFLVASCTFNPTAGAAATVKVELSPDNVTYSTVVIVTEPAGVALDGTVLPVSVFVPGTWFVKLTATNAVIGTATVY